jgi:hypothetical protein
MRGIINVLKQKFHKTALPSGFPKALVSKEETVSLNKAVEVRIVCPLICVAVTLLPQSDDQPVSKCISVCDSQNHSHNIAMP